MTKPTTKAEAMKLAATMDERGALSKQWGEEYRKKRRTKQAAELDGLALQFEHDARELRRLAESLPD